MKQCRLTPIMPCIKILRVFRQTINPLNVFFGQVSMNDEIRTYTLSKEKREICLQRISGLLEQEPGILFAYTYGSFLEAFRFRDLDIALFMMPDKLPLRSYVYEIELGTAIVHSLGLPFPVDVKIMNSTAIALQYHALRGRLLVDRNPDMRSEIMTRIASLYLDIAPILKHHTKEAFSRDAQP